MLLIFKNEHNTIKCNYTLRNDSMLDIKFRPELSQKLHGIIEMNYSPIDRYYHHHKENLITELLNYKHSYKYTKNVHLF